MGGQYPRPHSDTFVSHRASEVAWSFMIRTEEYGQTLEVPWKHLYAFFAYM